jgi:hypothetical protein
MLTDEELQARLAQAFHEQADPVTATAIDGAPIWRKATRDARGRSLFVSPELRPARPGNSTVWGRLIAATASATAVALLVTGVWLATHQMVRAQKPAGATPADRPPPYYVETAGSTLEVRSSATGQLLARATVRGGDIPLMTVAGNDRSFVIAEEALEASTRTLFYELHISKNGRSVRITSLPVPLPDSSLGLLAVSSMAVSPNGSTLAIATHAEIELVTLPTGRIQRTWTAPGGSPVSSLSWADKGSELGFALGSQGSSNGAYFALNVESPGTDLRSARQVASPDIGGKVLDGALLSPDGNLIALLLNTQGTMAYLVEVSARTGHPLRTLLTFPYSKNGYDDMIAGWNANGSYLMLQNLPSNLGWLDGTQYSELPGSSALLPQALVAFAW